MQLDAYVRALAADTVVRPKEIVVQLAKASDEVVDAINKAGPLSFALTDGRAISWATVRGNPWDTHDVVAAVCELSRAFPAYTFEVALEPDGERGTMQGGNPTGLSVSSLAAWVAQHPRPRFTGTKVRADLVLTLPARARRSVRAELEHYGQPNTVKRYPSDEQLTAFTGRAWRLDREGDALRVVVHHGNGSIDDRNSAALLGIDLATGETRTIELGNAHTRHVCASNGWLAWMPRNRNVVRVFHGLDHRADVELPNGNAWHVAISRSGAIAYVIAEPDEPGVLGLVRDGARAQVDIPEPVGVEWSAA
jgi:hypothetical protein